MEKKYLKVNSILFTILLFLLSWAIAVIYTLPSEAGLIFADFIFAISLLYFLFFIYSHQVVVKKSLSGPVSAAPCAGHPAAAALRRRGAGKGGGQPLSAVL